MGHILRIMLYCDRLKGIFHLIQAHFHQTKQQISIPCFDVHLLQLGLVFILLLFHMPLNDCQLFFKLIFIIFHQIHQIMYFHLKELCFCITSFCNPLDMIELHCRLLHRVVYANLNE